MQYDSKPLPVITICLCDNDESLWRRPEGKQGQIQREAMTRPNWHARGNGVSNEQMSTSVPRPFCAVFPLSSVNRMCLYSNYYRARTTSSLFSRMLTLLSWQNDYNFTSIWMFETIGLWFLLWKLYNKAQYLEICSGS